MGRDREDLLKLLRDQLWRHFDTEAITLIKSREIKN